MVFGTRQALKIFNVVVGFVFVDVVNVITVGDFAVEIRPNIAMNFLETASIITVVTFKVNYTAKLLPFVVNDGDARHLFGIFHMCQPPVEKSARG